MTDPIHADPPVVDAPDDLEPTESAEEAAPQEAEAQAPGRRKLPILAIVVGVLVATNVATGVGWFVQSRAGREERAVRAVAQRFARNLVSFDYRTLDADIARVRKDSTGNFQGELDVFGGAPDVREKLLEVQAQSHGVVHGTVVRSVTAETASVIVVLDQSTRNKERPEPQVFYRRVELTLVNTVRGWKVDRVAAQGGPDA